MTKKLILAAAAAVALCGMAAGANAQPLPGAHPAYLHALEDLRAARWFLYHQPGDPKVYAEEDMGITEIDAAIGEIKHAAIDDGKNLRDHPPGDVRDHGSRLLKSIEFLRQAHRDVDREEDNPYARGLKRRILEHIERATRDAERAHDEWLRDVRR